jgi:hypothetical protein
VKEMETIRTDLIIRDKSQGRFRERAVLVNHLKTVVRNANHDRQKVGRLRVTPTIQEALEGIMSKVSNILVGDAFDAEHWYDIIGYATLVVTEIEEAQAQVDAATAAAAQQIENQENVA